MLGLVSKKIRVETFKGEPRWCLEGKPLSGPAFMLRGGVELAGVFRAEGDEPPGKPSFHWRAENEETRVEVDPQRDEFRRPSEEEAKRSHFPVRTNIS
ncbi:MAG TPA: hypothetical protein VGY54_28510 [Polyangiaceae bacterium]|jgi:hypothetical protein|nr:hypothetical protein [Polyangiaceae bacterium]